MSIVVGIDPGLSGGICLMHLKDSGTTRSVTVRVMPTKDGPKKGRDVDSGQLRFLLGGLMPMIGLVVVEQVHSMPKQGVATTFKFGVNYGRLLGVLETLDLPVQLVTPQRWKKSVLDGLGREKSDAIRWVQGRFPGVSLLPTERCKKPSDGMAEAVCLAEFARRIWLKGEA